MVQFGLPILYVVFLWWFSTGLILYLDGLPRHTYRWSMLGATLLGGAALYGLIHASRMNTLTGTCMAFTAAIILWGWVEMSFLMGLITGPRRDRCPEGAQGMRRFIYALQAILHHEFALVAAAATVFLATWGAPDKTGLYTFLILWIMRTSTKLNVFLGVRNLNEEWLPDHLRYLESYFRKRPMNLLFPVSVTLSTVAAVLILDRALDPLASSGEVTGALFLATLMILAILEHWFLVLPLPSQALWQWAMRSRQPEEAHFRPIYPPIQAANDPDKNTPAPGFGIRPGRVRS